MQLGIRAQSETIGVVLFTGVILLVTVGAGAVIISNMASQADDTPSVNIEGQATTQNVTIYHTGGTKLATSDIAVILDGEQRERYSLGEFTQEIGNDDTRFEPGDGWSHANEVGDDNIRILVVHEPSNSILDDLTVSVEVTLVAKFSYSPGKPTRNDTVTFDASASEINPESEINSYDWDIDGTSRTGKKVEYNFSDIGEYPVTLTVTADDGRTANRTKSVRVYNAPPNPEFTYSPSNPDTGEDITFDASNSNDPDGSIVSYEWDFGDGTTGNGTTLNISYESEGNYTVQLNVTDDDGASRKRGEVVSVGGSGPPSVSITSSSITATGNSGKYDVDVTFEASDPDGDITNYTAFLYNSSSQTDSELDSNSSSNYGGSSISLTLRDQDTQSGDSPFYVVVRVGDSTDRISSDSTTVEDGDNGGSDDCPGNSCNAQGQQ